MTIALEDVLALEMLETTLRTLLPASYTDSYNVSPVSMGSAPLKYGIDGKVAWDEMWATFCDLAMAGGPAHRGTLLEPSSPDEIEADPAAYAEVVAEIARGIALVTGLTVEQDASPGWVSVRCASEGMAAWLVRAIVMENVLARHHDETLYLPAGPNFRLAKEIKNVVTTMAKTCHYWADHMPAEQRDAIESLLLAANAKERLLEPGPRAGDSRNASEIVKTGIGERLNLPCFAHRYAGWIGFECASVASAVWIVRAMVAENILARREGEVVFIPVNAAFLPEDCARVVASFTRAHRLHSISSRD